MKIFVLIRETDQEPSEYLGVFLSPKEASEHIKNNKNINYFEKEKNPIRWKEWKNPHVLEHDLGYGAFVLHGEEIKWR